MSSKTDNNSQYEPMKIPRLFTAENGQSAWGTVTVPLGIDLGDIGTMSDWCTSGKFRFRVTPGDYDFDWHNAPREQLIVMLDAAVECLTERDGAQVINRGEMLFVEDTTGKGHKSKAVNGELRHSLFIEVSRESLESIGCIFSDEA